jgi:hypothetical protein
MCFVKQKVQNAQMAMPTGVMNFGNHANRPIDFATFITLRHCTEEHELNGFQGVYEAQTLEVWGLLSAALCHHGSVPR